MMSVRPRLRYFIIWVWLMVFLILSIAASFLVHQFAALILIFAAAVIKALLVLRNYMHLKYENPFIYAVAIIPILIVIVLALALFPDFVLNTR